MTALLYRPSVPSVTPTGRFSGAEPVIAIDSIVQRFGEHVVLDSVSLSVAAGSIHALLGPNGAGKTTLIRILAGLLTPKAGTVGVCGIKAGSSRAFRQLIGLVPSGDRSFYLRISGLENLVFFARLHGLNRREAARRARDMLQEVGLADAADQRVGFYSHGMQKRLSVARALLGEPPILLVDEATHDLDPDGARRVRDLVAAAAGRGAAVLWATQRLDEIRGFADRVTVLDNGRAAFLGSVPELLAQTVPRRYLVRLRNDASAGHEIGASGRSALTGLAELDLAGDSGSGHYLLTLRDPVVLSDAFMSLRWAGISVLTCREERSELEEAFLALTQGCRA